MARGTNLVAVCDGGCSSKSPGKATQTSEKPKNKTTFFSDAWSKTKQVATSLWNNLDCAAGVGQGLNIEFDIADAIGCSIGAYGNYISAHLSDGKLEFGQELYAGATATFLFQDYGACDYMYMPIDGPTYEDRWVGINSNQETISIFGAKCYLLFLGASIEVNFNLNRFLEDLYEIF